MIEGLFCATVYVFVCFYSREKKRAYDRGLVRAGAFGINKDVFVKFAESSALQFLLAGALGVLAYWSQQDWGAYAPLAAMIISMAIDRIKKYQDREEE